MFEPLAIGNWTLNAEVSDDSRTRISSGRTGVNVARGRSSTKRRRAERDDGKDVPAARGRADPGAKHIKYTGRRPPGRGRPLP